MTCLDVLIVGAGPVGLFLANECQRRGLRWRLVEARSTQSEHSKALAIFPRTLEILDMAGLPIPKDMQGKSFAPVLKGKQKGDVHDALYYHFYENQEHKVAKQIGVRTERYKLIWFYENNEWELYDLEKDKSEMNNVYGQPAYKKVQEMMIKKLKEKKEQYKDPVALNDASKKA